MLTAGINWKKDLNIAWVSASPIARTGYGRVTREIGYRLIDAGVPVTFIGTFGDVVIWGGSHEQVTPKGNVAQILTLTDPASAPSVIESYAMRFGFNLVIGFMDCFGLEFLNNVNLPVVGYFPIDSAWTGEMANFCRNYYKIVAYSKFGYGELLKSYPPSKTGYIDHGVDMEQFRPLRKKEFGEVREWMERTDLPENESANIVPPIPRDCFLGIDLAANVGPRKNLPLLMRTWSKFVKQHPLHPPHLLIQTNPYAPGRGYDLVSHRISLGMEKYIHFPKYDPIVHPVSDEHLRKIYGASQVFVHNASAEGRCMPMVESMACGTPPIAPDNSAQTELVKGNGWLVQNIDREDYFEYPVYVPTSQEYPVPSQRSLLVQLNNAYENLDLVAKMGKRSRRFVVDNYSWNKIIPKWLSLFEDIKEDFTLFSELSTVLKQGAQA